MLRKLVMVVLSTVLVATGGAAVAAPAHATHDPTRPHAPNALWRSNVGHHFISIAWSPPKEGVRPDNYRVYVNRRYFTSRSPDELGVYIGGLTAGRKYHVWVRSMTDGKFGGSQQKYYTTVPRAEKKEKKPSSSSLRKGWRHPEHGASISRCYGGSHKGVDMYRGHRTPIGAANAGTVRYVGWNGGYGRLVVVQHGKYWTAYGHLDKTNVRKGQKIGSGKTVGWQGNTGDSTGSHLHFEVWKGGWYKKINPGSFMRQRGIKLGHC